MTVVTVNPKTFSIKEKLEILKKKLIGKVCKMTVTTVTTHEDREPPFPSFSPQEVFLIFNRSTSKRKAFTENLFQGIQPGSADALPGCIEVVKRNLHKVKKQIRNTCQISLF